jgi:phosphoserine phosphatase RsbU/P
VAVTELRWLVGLLAMLTVLGGLGLAAADEVLLVSLFVVGPALASTRLDGLATAMVSLYATVLAFVVTVAAGAFTGQTKGTGFLGVAVVSGISTAIAYQRTSQERSLRRVSRVAEVAQATIVRPIPARFGDLEFATAYRSAAEEARIGGDAYAAVMFPGGVRLLVADVRGKGLDAVRLAADVIASFREAAPSPLALTEVAYRLERSLRRALGREDFVTALLVEFVDDRMGLVSCGHPGPLLVHDGAVRELIIERPSRPLGLGVRPRIQRHPFTPGDSLLAYSDGLVEARSADGEFFDPIAVLAEHADEPPPHLLETLLARLDEHVAGHLEDDLAIVLVHRPLAPAPAGGEPPASQPPAVQPLTSHSVASQPPAAQPRAEVPQPTPPDAPSLLG